MIFIKLYDMKWFNNAYQELLGSKIPNINI